MSRLRGRLRRLEREAAPFYKTLTLPGGETLRYTGDEALEAMMAATRFLEAETAEGMPGLCRPLVGSREGG